jgi:hypothetical protein
VSPPETPEEVRAGRELYEAVLRGRTIYARFSGLLNTIEWFGPESDVPDDWRLRTWDIDRRNLWSVVDYIVKNRGQVPVRLDPIVAEIRTRLAALAKYPVIPGTPWAELRTILAKVEIFRQDTPGRQLEISP